MRSNLTPLDAAMAYLQAGLSFIPIARDGGKRPDGKVLPHVWDETQQRDKATWKPFQERLPTEAEAREWFSRPDPPGVAIVGGAVSGALEQLDFDNESASLFPAWCKLVEEECPGLVARLSVVRTPRQPAGYHVRYRCPGVRIPGNVELAMDPAKPPNERTLIETRGEGGYALAPGSPGECHETGRPYEHHSGPKLSQVQAVTPVEREVLLRCARYFDRRVAAEPPVPGLRPGEDYDRRGPDWEDILTPHRWTCTGRLGNERRWRRPGKEGNTWSATTGHCKAPGGEELFRVFTSSAVPFEQGKSYGKFRVFALLNHGGDFSAAARVLSQNGFGSPAPPPNGQGQRAAQSAQPQPGVPPPAPVPVLLRVSEVARRKVVWVMRHWIPRGELSILDGDPGLGKSSLTLDWAARISRGWKMPPDGGVDPERKPAGVLLLSAEDDIGCTIRPRLEEMGADLSRVHIFDAVREGTTERPPVLPWDLDLVEAQARELGVGFIVADPFTAYLASEFDAHKDQDVRRCLYQLSIFARRLACALILIRHLNKLNGGAALYRGGGSIGITGHARASLVVGRDPGQGQEGVRVLAMNKSNLGPIPKSLAYQLEPSAAGDVCKLAWIGETDLTPSDILWHDTTGQRGAGKSADPLKEACQFLVEQLSSGPMLIPEIRAEAEHAGIAWRTLERAKAELRVTTIHSGRDYSWQMPTTAQRAAQSAEEWVDPIPP